MTARTDCESIYPRLVSLCDILFKLRDSHLDGWEQEGVLLLFQLPLGNDFIVDRKREGECWGLIGGEKFLCEVWNFDDFVNMFYNASIRFAKHK